jgi:dephospho-CoA kinase
VGRGLPAYGGAGILPRVNRVRVGLTGGVASGKSTVSSMLRELGAVVIDADQLAREVVAPGTEGLAEIVTAFGDGVLTPEGELDRPGMAAIVFGDEEARRRLEGIIHPRVRRRGAELEAAAGPDSVVVHDIPLLAETGRPSAFDAVVVVDVPVETQVRRMVELRGMSRDEAEARIAAQASREDRLAIATHVIDNTGTPEDLRERVAEVFESLVSSAGRTV